MMRQVCACRDKDCPETHCPPRNSEAVILAVLFAILLGVVIGYWLARMDRPTNAEACDDGLTWQQVKAKYGIVETDSTATFER